jgi:uncharacterized protein (TIGR00725 family)
MRTVIGVMGGGVADETTLAKAVELGRLIAEKDWVLLNGGRNAGVMAASAQGASEAGGLVIGILPGESRAGAAPHVDIAIPTGLNDARNAVNALASHVVVALRGGAGTLSEVALALKNGRPVIALSFPLGVAFGPYYECGQLVDASTPAEAILHIERLLSEEYA